MGDDAAVGEARAIVGGIVVIVARMQQHIVAMRGRRRPVERPDALRMGRHRDRHLRRRHVIALGGAIELLAQRIGRWELPPAPDAAMDGRRLALSREGARGIEFLHGGAERRDIPAMAVEQVDLPEPRGRERRDDILHHGGERRGPERDRTGKAQVELRHAVGQRGRDQNTPFAAEAAGDRLRAEVIRADQAIGTVLLGRADRHDDALLVRQIGGDRRRRHLFELHRRLPLVWCTCQASKVVRRCRSQS